MLCFFTTPWKPWPLLRPMTSTTSPTANCFTERSTVSSSFTPSGRRNSFTSFFGSLLAFLKTPSAAFFTRLSFCASKPTCTPLYPSVSTVFFCRSVLPPASITVTGVIRPAVSYTRVIPSFLPKSPIFMVVGSSDLDGDVHTSREVELAQLVHGLRGRLDNVEQPLVGADFELIHALLVDVRRAVH